MGLHKNKHIDNNIITSCCSSGNKRIKRSNTTYRSRWSDLPQELLEKIIQEHKENDISHVARIRAVCKSWRSCLPNPNLYLKRPSPFLACFPDPCPYGKEEPEYKYKYNVTAVEVVVVALHPLDPNNPNRGILKLKREDSGKLRAMNPLVYNENVSNRVTTVSEVVNLLDYRVQLLHRSHYIKDRYAEILKIVVSGDVICALYSHDEDNDRVGLLKFGDKKWTKIEGNFQDITVYGGKFFAVNNEAFLFMIDPLSLRETRIVGECPLQDDDCNKYLVESLGGLFLVAEDHKDKYDMEVYKLDKAKGRWRRVYNLRNNNFFVGDQECSFSISDKDFPLGVCKKWNCVYYEDFYSYDGEVRVQRGLSTKSAYLYSMNKDDSRHHYSISACPPAMEIFWNLKPRKRRTEFKVYSEKNAKAKKHEFTKSQLIDTPEADRPIEVPVDAQMTVIKTTVSRFGTKFAGSPQQRGGARSSAAEVKERTQQLQENFEAPTIDLDAGTAELERKRKFRHPQYKCDGGKRKKIKG